MLTAMGGCLSNRANRRIDAELVGASRFPLIGMAMKARVTVTLKSGILDPQGKAIEGALRSLGVGGVASVRQGKVFDIEIEGSDRAGAEAALKNAAEKLLANTVIENYRDRGDGMKSAVIVFPGINRERDMARALKLISGREPAMVWHADTRAAGRHRSRRHSRRLLLWRLSALRRHRGARADHGRGARLRRQRRAGARGLQRLSDRLRGRAVARRADAQRAASLHLPRRLSAGRALRYARLPAATMPAR